MLRQQSKNALDWQLQPGKPIMRYFTQLAYLQIFKAWHFFTKKHCHGL